MLHGTIFGTIFYPLGLIACVFGVYSLKKSFQQLNGFVWLILSFLITIAMGGIVAGLISPLHIPVNLYSMGIVYFVLAGILFYLIKKEGKRQSYVWEKYDMILLLGITLGMVVILIKQFSPALNYCYYNTDAGLHLKEATLIVRSQKVTMMYFMHLQNAMVIEMVSPFVRTADLFKGYILGDWFFFLVETMFFAALIRGFLKTMATKVFGIVILIAYTLGYPYFGYYYSFGYWAMGAMYVGFLVLALRLYEEALVERKYTVFMLMLGRFGVITSYMLFAPMTFIAVFFYLAVLAKREGKIFALKNVWLSLKVFLLPTIYGLLLPVRIFYLLRHQYQRGFGKPGGNLHGALHGLFLDTFPGSVCAGFHIKTEKAYPGSYFFPGVFPVYRRTFGSDINPPCVHILLLQILFPSVDVCLGLNPYRGGNDVKGGKGDAFCLLPAYRRVCRALFWKSGVPHCHFHGKHYRGYAQPGVFYPVPV